jgi:hypothetical protein
MKTKTRKSVFIAVGAILVALAVTFFYAALTTMPETNRQWKSASVQATGTIVEVRQEFRNRAYLYYPVVDFPTKEGKMVRFYPNVYSANPSGYRQGERIAVRYRESDPQAAYVDSDTLDAATIRATIGFGIFLLIAGGGMIVAGVRTKDPAAS